jgi:hypothetical protein
MLTFPATVQTRIQGQPDAVFAHIAPIDLASVFTGYGPLPAVTGTRDQTGPWDTPGQTRTTLLSDGSSATERLIQYESPRYLSYTVSGFTGVLRFFTSSAKGEWWFDAQPAAVSGGATAAAVTSVKWRYAFEARSALAAPVLWLIANALWRGYMRKALRLAKQQMESNAATAQAA